MLVLHREEYARSPVVTVTPFYPISITLHLQQHLSSQRFPHVLAESSFVISLSTVIQAKICYFSPSSCLFAETDWNFASKYCDCILAGLSCF